MMKKVAIVLLFLGFAINACTSAQYLDLVLNDFDSLLSLLSEYGVESFLSQSACVAILAVSLALSGILTAATAFFLFWKKKYPAVIMGLGIADLFLVSLLSGIFVIIYASSLRYLAAFPQAGYSSAQSSPETPKTGPSRPSPSDYDAPSSSSNAGFAIGDKALTPDGRIGIVVSLKDGEAVVRFTDGSRDLIVQATDLRKP